MNNWLESFALLHLPAHLLHCSLPIFKAAREKNGGHYLLKVAKEYALEQNHREPAPKCLALDYTDRYEGFEALFIQVWPCLSLSKPPIYLAAVRKTASAACRLFRLHYPADKQLSLSEMEVDENGCASMNLPTYEDATALIFSYTLGTPCFIEEVLEKEWEIPILYPQQKMLVN